MGERSACEGMDTERFYVGSDSRPGVIAGWDALEVCAGCPVRAECLLWALRWPAYHQWGVVGGTVAWQRRALLESADQGRAA